MKGIEKQYSDTLKNSERIVVDMSDTAVVGNIAYGGIFLPWERAKEGKLLDALGLAINIPRLYVVGHISSPTEVLKEYCEVLDNYKVTKNELSRVLKRYAKLPFVQRKGFDDFTKKIRNYGKPKEMILLTREPKECADAANLNGFKRKIANGINYYSNGTVNGAELRMNTPEDAPKVLEQEIGSDNMKTTVVISNDETDQKAFRGKVGLFIPFSKRGKKGELHINDFEEFAKRLHDSD